MNQIISQIPRNVIQKGGLRNLTSCHDHCSVLIITLLEKNPRTLQPSPLPDCHDEEPPEGSRYRYKTAIRHSEGAGFLLTTCCLRPALAASKAPCDAVIKAVLHPRK